MQRHSIPFAILEVGDVPMFTDAGLRHQRLSAIGIDLGQGSLDVGHGKVDQGPGMGWRVMLGLHERPRRSGTSLGHGEPRHFHGAHFVEAELETEHGFVELSGSLQIIHWNLEPIHGIGLVCHAYPPTSRMKNGNIQHDVT